MVQIGSTPFTGDFVGQMLKLEREIRGGLLAASVQVERALDLVLANHFCKPQSERWWQLYMLVLASGEITFQRKSKIVLELLRISYPHLLKRYPDIKVGLDRVRKRRNEVAHYESGMSHGFATGQPPDHIILVIYSKGKRSFKRLTLKEAREMKREASKIFEELGEVAHAIHVNWASAEKQRKDLLTQ